MNKKQKEELNNLDKVNRYNLKLGWAVRDYDGNKGRIVTVNDPKNVEVSFENGGIGFYCFVPDNDLYSKLERDQLFYL